MSDDHPSNHRSTRSSAHDVERYVEDPLFAELDGPDLLLRIQVRWPWAGPCSATFTISANKADIVHVHRLVLLRENESRERFLAACYMAYDEMIRQSEPF